MMRAVEAVVRTFEPVGKTKLLGGSVRVGPKQLPRVHNIVESCALTLGITTPTTYIVNNPVINASTFGTNDSAVIMIHSGLVDHLSDDELAAVIGHECGHIHNNHVTYLTALHMLTFAAGFIVQWIDIPARLFLNAWSRRAEISADRASMLCVRQADVCQRSVTKLALGSLKLYEDLNHDAFLEQYEELRQRIGRLGEVFNDHPWLPKRVLAMRVFEKSRLYRQRAGLGKGGLSMDDVDEQVHKIVKVL